MQNIPARKTGIFIWFGYRLPLSERVRLIREAGFKTVLHWWDDSFLEEEGYTKEEQTELIRREGLVIENAHLRFDHINDLWYDTLAGQAVLEGYLSDIDGLAAQEIPVAVLHPTRGFEAPPLSFVGMSRIHRLVEHAEKRGVKIAMENVRSNTSLTTILDSVASPMLGLCYDYGHDFVWSKTPYELPRRYQDRLFAVHLHDNMGINDDHLAPGEGMVNWANVRDIIDASSYEGSYTLESDSAVIPAGRTPLEHLLLHYKGAKAMLFP
ncbi:MAG: sugar phosphate isomerase/epimerase family protein [Clostridium sp.]|uniref:sugar phosphate isomerase/epimerase family protein n=1 Tax=Eisenbergiella porci TaxID=2652274 RepID=UPI0029155014|nr:sugar phosphate isomerase/epimerase family protein [Clostridium sp.]